MRKSLETGSIPITFVNFKCCVSPHCQCGTFRVNKGHEEQLNLEKKILQRLGDSDSIGIFFCHLFGDSYATEWPFSH